jgi:hypothetical protein
MCRVCLSRLPGFPLDVIFWRYMANQIQESCYIYPNNSLETNPFLDFVSEKRSLSPTLVEEHSFILSPTSCLQNPSTLSPLFVDIFLAFSSSALLGPSLLLYHNPKDSTHEPPRATTTSLPINTFFSSNYLFSLIYPSPTSCPLPCSSPSSSTSDGSFLSWLLSSLHYLRPLRSPQLLQISFALS